MVVRRGETSALRTASSSLEMAFHCLPSDEVSAFSERWRGSYVEDRLRNDWLLELIKRRDWANFAREYPRFRMNDDREVTCFWLLTQHLDGVNVRDAALAAWREQRAVASDKPRGWIVTDEAVYALATLAPATTADLEQVASLPPSVVRKRGDELLELIRHARESRDTGPVAPMPERPTAEQNRRIGQLQQRVKDVAASLGISPEVLATRRDVEGMVLGSPERSALLRGWRREVIGQQLLDLLA